MNTVRMRSSPIWCLLLLIIISCSDDNAAAEEPAPYVAPAEDVAVFDKIQKLAVKAEETWPGFDYYKTQPAYLLLSNETETEYRGYIFNPPDGMPDDAQKVNEEQSRGMNIYRSDKLNGLALNVLKNGTFDGNNFKIAGIKTFLIKDPKKPSALQFYDDFKDVDDNQTALLFIHEWFHVFQFDEWTFPPNTGQDFANYPVNEEIMTIELALFDLMKTLPDVSNTTARKDHLAKFVSLLDELFKVDPSSTQIVKKMVLVELFLEGSARYMEHYSALQTIYPTIDSDLTHAWGAFLPSMPPGIVQHFLSVRVWYHVGSGALFLLQKEGVDITTKTENGETAYSLAKQHLGITAEQQAEIVEELKASSEWSGYEEMANKLVTN